MTIETTTEARAEAATSVEEEKFLPNSTEDQLRRFAEGQMKKADRLDGKREEKKRQKRVEKAVALWYTTSLSWMEQIQNATFAIAKRIESDPDCYLASIFTSNELRKFAGSLADTSSILSNIYPLIGKPIVDPLDAMDEE
jgi:hypothetical protein